MAYRFGLGKHPYNASNRAMAVGCPLVCRLPKNEILNDLQLFFAAGLNSA